MNSPPNDVSAPSAPPAEEEGALLRHVGLHPPAPPAAGPALRAVRGAAATGRGRRERRQQNRELTAAAVLRAGAILFGSGLPAAPARTGAHAQPAPPHAGLPGARPRGRAPRLAPLQPLTPGAALQRRARSSRSRSPRRRRRSTTKRVRRPSPRRRPSPLRRRSAAARRPRAARAALVRADPARAAARRATAGGSGGRRRRRAPPEARR